MSIFVYYVHGWGTRHSRGQRFDPAFCGNNIDCAVFTVSQRLSADSAYYAEQAAELGVTIIPLCVRLFGWV